MKKLYLFLALFIFSFGFCAKALADADQLNLGDNTNGWWYIKIHSPVGQTFRPTGDKITHASVLVNGGGSSTTINMEIKNADTNAHIASSSSFVGSGSSWIAFSFSGQALVPDGRYVMYLTTDSNTAYWYRQGDTYSRGYGIVEGVQLAQDFDFTEWSAPYPGGGGEPGAASSPSVTASTVSQPTPAADQSNVASTSNSAPNTNTDSSIKAPSELKISNSATDDKPSLKLDWKKFDTSDIDGYKVFRSDDDKIFKEVGQTKKTELIFTDVTVSSEKTYYYYVRSYKGSKQSANSNTVFLTVPKVVAVVAPTEAAVVELANEKSSLVWLYILIGAIVLASGGFAYYWFKIRKKKVKKET
jgi:hypothetical protein